MAAAIAVVGLPLITVTAPAQAAQPQPNHSTLVPDVPRKDTPRIGNGEIWDIEVVGSRVFIAGSFTSLANTTGANRTTVSQRYLAAYNINTGLIDTTFRPTFNRGVNAVEASPDGTKLFVGGTFSTISGVARQKVASLNLTTGAPVSGFATTRSTNNAVTALAATNSTLYVGGRFSRINGELMTGLAALNADTGDVDPGFDNQLSGGIGVNGALTVPQLKLTHDDSKLLVVHTGRKIAGEDRLGIGIISTSTKQLLPWRTRLWDEYLPIVGGVQRIYAGDIAPNDQYFVVGSGSGGDRPPISDTAIAFDISGGDNQEPLWVSRMFDSIYSVAITEEAVYVGGHFGWNESPTANQPWPGLDNVGYGTGQGLSGYGLGDQVVRREHIGALDPQTGTALEWNPWSNSFEGNKAMEATSRGLFVGGDGMFQGGVRTGRVAFYDFNSVPAPSTTDTTIDTPIEGRVVTSGVPFTIQGTAKNPQGIRRVQVWIQDSNTKRYLQDDGTTWGSNNNILATLGTGTTNREWALPVTITGTRNLKIMAKTIGTNGAKDPTKATKKIESFSFDDETPTHQRHRTQRDPDLHLVHHDGDRDRRSRRELAHLLVPRRKPELPAERRNSWSHLQHLPWHSRCDRGYVGHLVVRRHPAARGNLARQRDRRRHRRAGRPPQRCARLQGRLHRVCAQCDDQPAASDDTARSPRHPSWCSRADRSPSPAPP